MQVRSCISGNVTTSVCCNLAQKIEAVTAKLWESSSLAKKLLGFQTEKGDLVIEDVCNQFCSDANLVFELTCGDKGIRFQLYKLLTPIKAAIQDAIDQKAGQFTDLHVNINRSLPEDLFQVFGEKEVIVARILHNLLDNVINWAKASEVFITLRPDSYAETVELWIIDNGVGMKNYTDRGTGLKNVETALRWIAGDLRVCGAETIREPGVPDFKSGTVAIVRFKWLRGD